MTRKTTTPSQGPACQVCGSTLGASLRPAALVRPAIAQLVEAAKGRWEPDGWLCVNDLQQFQHRYVQSLLETEKGELTELELEVVRDLREHTILARNPDEQTEPLSVGQRLADRIASFGGSWRFIVSFGILLMVWMLVNTLLIARPFDPYPFILLNLLLSTLAALQAPVIMMSQNRQEERDRRRALHDYQINLKAELEIRQLHQKVDHLLSRQWERLVEIQEIQMELIEEVRRRP